MGEYPPIVINSSTQSFGEQLVIAAITTFGAFVVYLFGQIFTKFFIDPIQEQKRIIGEIADSLIFYANLYSHAYTPDKYATSGEKKRYRERVVKAGIDLRKLATSLMSKTQIIPSYNFFAFLGIVKPKKKIAKTHISLIGLSNTLGLPSGTFSIRDVHRYESEITESLGIYSSKMD